jgi:hypothetical protein
MSLTSIKPLKRITRPDQVVGGQLYIRYGVNLCGVPMASVFRVYGKVFAEDWTTLGRIKVIKTRSMTSGSWGTSPHLIRVMSWQDLRGHDREVGLTPFSNSSLRLIKEASVWELLTLLGKDVTDAEVRAGHEAEWEREDEYLQQMADNLDYYD